MAELSARIIAKASGTASEEPLAADLEVAELAVNTADGKLFTKHTDGSVVTISGGGGGGGSVIVPTTAPPSSISDTGTQGELRFDTDHLYLCIATDSWKRTALSTWTPTDSTFASVALLLHADGTNGSTTFTDSSNNDLTAVLTSTGTSQLSTAQYKFGTASLDFNSGTSSAIQLPSTDNSLDVAVSEDFTIEWWMYVTAFSTSGPSGTSTNAIAEFVGSVDYSWNLLSSSASSGECRIVFAQNFSSSGIVTHQDNIPTNQWVHFAHVRSSDVNTLYLNGVASTSTFASGSALNNSNFWSIGPRQSGSANRFYMDEVRVTIGIARYTADFTPPTAAFPDS